MHKWERIKKSRLTPYLLSFFFFLLFWFFRSAVFDGGSSDQWVREIEGGVWFRKRRMLAVFLMQVSYQITNRINHWDGRLAINLASCLAGAVFVFILYRLCSRWEKRWIPFFLVITSGMAVLFYGHIETYPQSVAATMLFLYALLEYAAGRLSPIYPAAAYSFAAMFHMQLGFLFPILPVAWYLSGAKTNEIKEYAKGLAPLVLVWIAVDVFRIGEGDLWQNLLFVFPVAGVVGIDSSSGRYVVDPAYTWFSRKHLADWVWFQYRIAVIALPTILALALLKKIDWKDKTVQILAIASACLLFYTFISYPFNGPRTWDVMAIVGLPTTLLAGYLLIRLRRVANFIGSILIIISIAVSIPWIVPRAKLGQRGEGTILIQNIPPSAVVLLDGYREKPIIYHVLQGNHYLKIIHSPNKIEREIEVIPNQTVVIQYQTKLGKDKLN